MPGRVLLTLLLLLLESSPSSAEKRLVFSYRPSEWFRDIWGEAAISPDARMIAFIRQNEIWTVPVAGGAPAQRTSDRASKLGLTWLGPSDLVFNTYDGVRFRLWRLSLDGDEREEMFPGGEPVLAPAWSHDGKRVAFASGPILSPRIGSMEADGGERRSLSPEGLPAWSPAWSPDDQHIAFVSFVFKPGYYVPRTTSLWLMKADGTEPRELTRELRIPGRPGRAFPKIAFTPDGKEIFVAGSRGEGSLDLWAVAVSGGEIRRVTDLAGDEISPSFSRDGSLAFVSQVYLSSVAVTSVDGGVVWNAAPPMSSLPYWSPDGRRLSVMFGEWRQSDWTETWDLATLGVDPQRARFGPLEPEVVGDHEDFGLVWSPDGRWIAFHSHRGGTDDIYVRRAEGGPEIRLSRGGQEVGAPAWSPDGRRLLFDGYLPGKIRTEGLWVVDFDLETGKGMGEPSVLDLDGYSGEATYPVWSPDGKEIAFVGKEASGSFGVFVAPASGGWPRKLTGFVSYDLYTGLDWSRDGKWLAFSAWQDGSYDIFAVPAGGGALRRLTSGELHESHPRFSPDGRYLAFTVWGHQRMYWVEPARP